MQQTEKQNSCEVKSNVLTVVIQMEGPAALAKALGSLELAKDVAKQHFMRAAMMEARRHSQSIIRPGSLH